ncbi:hypothetical protein [Mesorhizobium sp.]|nr:hypothetical protein [Mesorhizobium sp.]
MTMLIDADASSGFLVCGPKSAEGKRGSRKCFAKCQVKQSNERAKQ